MPRIRRTPDATAADNGEKESPKERFHRLANARLGKLQSVTRGVAALANKATYDYDAEEAASVVAFFKTQYDRVLLAFETGKADRNAFKLF